MRIFLITARTLSKVQQIEHLPVDETLVVFLPVDNTIPPLPYHSKLSETIGYWDVLNECIEPLEMREPFVWLADDIAPQEGWFEQAVDCFQDNFPKGLGLVVLNDLHLKDGGAAFGMTTKAWLYVIFGYPRLPYLFGHGLLDTLIADRSKDLGRYYFCEEAVMEHLHHSIGKSEDDEIYQNNRRRAKRFRDKAHKDNMDMNWEVIERKYAQKTLQEMLDE